MNIRRIGQLWKEHGTFGLIRHAFQKSPIYLSLAYCKDQPTDGCTLPGLLVEKFSSEQAIDSASLIAINSVMGERQFIWLKTLFNRGCELWVGRLDGHVAGICWSKCDNVGEKYYLRLTKTDAMILSCMVFPEFRGRGIYPAMLETMVQTMMGHNNVGRVFIDCKSWNTPSIRGILKAGFYPIGKALRLDLFNRMWILWNSVPITGNRG